jgi:type III secretion protein C
LNTANVGNQPDATSLVTQSGFSLGLIGRTITKNGVDFASIGALVRAIHTRSTTNIIMNPKIIVEDNAKAEIFVGINTAFQTSSIANDLGNIVTSNFDFRDVGTRLAVTPLLSNTDIITLDIEQTISNITTIQTQNTSLTNQNPGPTTSQNNTKTRVHVPDGYFLVISGMIQDQENRTKSQVPCVGGIPFIGGIFGQKDNSDTKRNVMIFMRPQIVDSEEDIDRLTKQQQDCWNQKNRRRAMYQYEVDEALDHFNVKPLDCCVEDPLRNDYLHGL